MRLSIILSALLFSATAAQAQVQFVGDSTAGRDCYRQARLGINLREGLESCDLAIKKELMTQDDLAATYDNRGVILSHLNRVDRAQADFQKAIQLKPDLGDAYVNLGSMLILKQRHEEALVQINKGIDLGSSFPHFGYYNRAVAQHLLGRYREAYYDYRKVLKLEPNFTLASERLKDFVVRRVPANSPG